MLVRRTRVFSTLAAVIALAGFLGRGLSPRLQADDGGQVSASQTKDFAAGSRGALAGPVEPSRPGRRPRSGFPVEASRG